MTFRTSKLNHYFNIAGSLSALGMLLVFRANYVQMELESYWWAMLLLFLLGTPMAIYGYSRGHGFMDIDADGIRIRGMFGPQFSYNWADIEGFGRKRLLGFDFPTIRKKGRLIPGDEVMLFRKYGLTTSRFIDILETQRKSFAKA